MRRSAQDIIEMLEWLTPVKMEWAAKNFPDETPVQVLFGVIEEVGELSQAHAKEQFGIRGTPEQHQAMAKDAVGDIVIFLVAYEQYRNLSLSQQVLMTFGTKAEVMDSDRCLLGLANQAGRMARGELNMLTFGKTKSFVSASAAGRLMYFLNDYCYSRGWDLVEIVTEVWREVVSKRDWKANPQDGSTPEPGLSQSEEWRAGIDG